MKKLNNLIDDAWIPIKRKSGHQGLIAPWQITETQDPVISLDAPRPDFNGALVQFMIGLLQTATAPNDEGRWIDWLEQPPTPQELKNAFSAYSHAFELESDQGSFMQDFDSLKDITSNSISELLIDSPGGNTLKENKDHFIKRDNIKKLCAGCTVTALFTLQTNAPSGGQGHRTSLRGGGPLTTLVVLDEYSDLQNDLWRNLWLNILVPHQQSLTGNTNKRSDSDIFPWLAPTRISEKTTGCVTTPMDTSPLQMYWGMPRRIKVHWQSDISGHCDLCHANTCHLVTHYRTKNYGINYTGAWEHPLSPYYISKTNDLIAVHAQPGGITYQHWSHLALNDDSGDSKKADAQVVKRYHTLLSGWNAGQKNDGKEQFRLTAFGYDMDNMKARCWYENTFPLITIAADIRIDFANRVQLMTGVAVDFADFTQSCIKEAWFKRPTDKKGDMSFLKQAFYQHSENKFYQLIKLLPVKIEMADGSDKDILRQWHKILQETAFQLFDYWAMRGDLTQTNPRRIARAYRKLKSKMNSKKIKEQLFITTKTQEAT